MAKKSDLPRSIVIGGRRFAIKWVPEESMDDWGHADTDGGCIRINEKCLKANNAEETLLHEMGHIVTEISGIKYVIGDDADEAVVRALDNLYTPAIKLLVTKHKLFQKRQ
jgi:hypothetical protein